jgi:uncharacterized protein
LKFADNYSRGYVRSSELRSRGSLLNAFFYSCGDEQPAPVVVLLHGWPGNPGNPLELAPKICAGGVHVLVFKYQGTWGSEGFTSLKNSAEDVVQAVNFLKEKGTADKYGIDTSKIVVAGYSYGGGVMLATAMHFPGIDRMISIAGADTSAFIRTLETDAQFRKNFEERLLNGTKPNSFAKMEGSVTEFLDDLFKDVAYFDPVENAPILKDKKILFIVGWDDTTGKMEINALPLYRKLKELNAPDVSIIAFQDDHTFTRSRDGVAQAIIEWAKER